MSKDDNHLPLYGVGPVLVAPIIITAILVFILTKYNMLPVFKINSINWLLDILGVIIIIIGAYFWITSVKSDIQDKIKTNTLQTTGIYARIRHPIYAAFL